MGRIFKAEGKVIITTARILELWEIELKRKVSKILSVHTVFHPSEISLAASRPSASFYFVSMAEFSLQIQF